jgi:hypothetical protein
MSDMELLNRDVCSLSDRLKFKTTVDCEGAERRLRISVQMCTFYTWGSESSISRIFYELTGSYWALVGVILPLVIAYMYFWNQRKMLDRFGELFKEKRHRLTNGRAK